MTMFRRGLKDNVKNEFMRNGAFIENFEELIEQAIEIDDKLYERVMEKRVTISHSLSATNAQ